MTDIHSCSYFCDRPACVKRQRDNLREILYEREWQGLTDDEIEHIWDVTPPDYVDKFALPRMIETALKSKNSF